VKSILNKYITGFTLIELVIVMAVLAILASVAMPLARMSVKKGKELELRQNLRIMRQAIDKYKENYDKHLYKKEEEVDRSGYPKTLEELVEKKVLRTKQPKHETEPLPIQQKGETEEEREERIQHHHWQKMRKGLQKDPEPWDL